MTRRSPTNGCRVSWMRLSNAGRTGTRRSERSFRSALQSYIRLYGYISQLITFTDADLEKLYVFGRSLNKKLPKREAPDVSGVLSSVDLDSFRMQEIHRDLQLKLESEDSEVPGIGSGEGTIADPEEDLLSHIIRALNDAHQTDFTEEDKVDIAAIHRKVSEKRVASSSHGGGTIRRATDTTNLDRCLTRSCWISSITRWNCSTSYQNRRLRNTSRAVSIALIASHRTCRMSFARHVLCRSDFRIATL